MSARGCSSRVDDDRRRPSSAGPRPARSGRRTGRPRSPRRPAAASERERVLALARSTLPALGDVLGGLAHRVRVVALRELRVDEAPAERRVVRARAGRGPTAASALAMTYGARVIDSTPPPMNTSPSPTAIAWAAELIAWSPEPHSRLTVSPPTSTGQPGQEQRHPRDVAVVLAGLVGAAEDDVLDERRVDARRGRRRRGSRPRRGRRAGPTRGRRRSGRSASGPPRRSTPRGAAGRGLGSRPIVGAGGRTARVAAGAGDGGGLWQPARCRSSASFFVPAVRKITPSPLK